MYMPWPPIAADPWPHYASASRWYQYRQHAQEPYSGDKYPRADHYEDPSEEDEGVSHSETPDDNAMLQKLLLSPLNETPDATIRDETSCDDADCHAGIPTSTDATGFLDINSWIQMRAASHNHACLKMPGMLDEEQKNMYDSSQPEQQEVGDDGNDGVSNSKAGTWDGHPEAEEEHSRGSLLHHAFDRENSITPEQAVHIVMQAPGPEAGEMPPDAIEETLKAAGIPLSKEHLDRAAHAASCHKYPFRNQYNLGSNASHEQTKDPPPIPCEKPSPMLAPVLHGILAAPRCHNRDRPPDTTAQGGKDGHSTEAEDDDADDVDGDKKSVKSEPLSPRDWSPAEADRTR